ncbi:hypothetical protein MKC54_05695 [[Clostridium] innocuum]|nr:hypothetical protein [[Clostridium] innocuum]MCR0576375.1 hypothetical protein [[Clostridium] innocuum]
MHTLDIFLNRIKGAYSNRAQHTEHTSLPQAIHITTPVNERINNLPKNFDHVFVIDETYYRYEDHMMELHHLYRYHAHSDGSIALISYELPSESLAQKFDRQHVQQLSYNELTVKQSFSPILYTFENDVFTSEGSSEIAPGITLHVVMKLYRDHYTVIEACYANGTLVSGFEEPVCYERMIEQEVV